MYMYNFTHKIFLATKMTFRHHKYRQILKKSNHIDKAVVIQEDYVPYERKVSSSIPWYYFIKAGLGTYF